MKIFSRAIVLATTAACASSTPSPELQPGEIRTAQAPAASRNRDVITLQDIAADASLKAQTVLDVVRTLRPHFLNTRGLATNEEMGRVHVNIDNGRMGALTDLNTIMAATVLEIRYYNIAQAMQKFGGLAMQGPVIAVKTVK